MVLERILIHVNKMTWEQLNKREEERAVVRVRQNT